MVTPAYPSLLDHLKTSSWLAIAVGSFTGFFVLLGLPFFLDNLLDLAIFCLLIPLFLAASGAFVFIVIQRLTLQRHRVETLQLPFAYMISLLICITAGALSWALYSLVSDGLILHLSFLPIYFLLWFLVITRVAKSKRHFSLKYLAWISLSLVAGVIVLFTIRSDFRHFKAPAKIFVFGVDGATWSIINPLIEKGHLANIARMKKEGSYAVLRSIEPTLSPVVWTTIATGKTAEKHGIKDFYSTQDSLRTRRLWDILEAGGMRIGVFKWLITWPPKKVNGFVIPDILARDDQTFPPEYSAINSLRIMEKSFQSVGVRRYVQITWSLMNMGLRMSTLRTIGWDLVRDWLQNGDHLSRYPLKRRAELQINKDVFIYLLRKHQPHFVTFYDNGVDILSHKYWKYHEPNHFSEVDASDIRRFGNIIPGYYELIDQTVGELMQYFNSETLIFVLSDHGMQASNSLGNARYDPKLTVVLDRLQLDSVVYQIALGRRYYVRLKDPSQTGLLKNVQEKLKDIKVVETGEKLFDSMEDDSGLVIRVRQMAVNFDHHVRIGNKDLEMEELVYRQPPYSGTHHVDGILLTQGPNVRAGIEISNASILDITPTILYLEKAPISQEIDGKILFPAISESFQKGNSAHFVPDSEADKLTPAKKIEFDQQTEERLKSLGYVQ